MTKLRTSHVLAGLIVSSGIATSIAIVSYSAFAQATPPASTGNGATIQGIAFPIPELGNCSNETDCRAYCNDPSHMQACTAFASNHGLINKQDTQKAQNFARALQSGGGPGGCTTPDQCAAYCSDLTHLDACLAFAKTYGINDDHVAQGKKISAYINSGGHMPGGCTSEDSCQAYCGDFSHAQECYEFAKAAGIDQANGQARGGGLNGTQAPTPTPDQLQKLSELAKNGQTPGGCKSKDDCETYCTVQSHLDECLTFGVKAGFMTQAQADAIKSGGGNGPGGCRSSETCQAYCNDSAHQAECFKFAEDHGFINKNDEKQIQNGLLQVRSGFDHMPPEVVACIKSSLDPATVTQIESGHLIPGPDVANQIRSCFDKFGHKENPGQIFQNLPDTVLSCVKDKLGGDFAKIQSGSEMPTPAMADTIRVCFQSMQLQQMQEDRDQQDQDGQPGPSRNGQNFQNGGAGRSGGHGFQDFLQTAPPDVLPCLQQALGSDFDQFKSGSKQPDPGVSQKIQSCFNSFHPMAPPPQDSGNPGPDDQGIFQGQPDEGPAGFQGGMGYPTSTGGYNNPPPPQGYSTGTQRYLGPPTLAPPCPSGQYWNGTTCMAQTISNPATACSQSGGTWTGTTCQMPQPKPASSTSFSGSPQLMAELLNSMRLLMQTLTGLLVR